MSIFKLPEDKKRINKLKHGDTVEFKGRVFTYKEFDPGNKNTGAYFHSPEKTLNNKPLIRDGKVLEYGDTVICDPSVYLQPGIKDSVSLYNRSEWMKFISEDCDNLKTFPI